MGEEIVRLRKVLYLALKLGATSVMYLLRGGAVRGGDVEDIA